MIIKRYNRKTIVRGLRYCLRTSKARIAWRNAHLLKISGIKTPGAIAFVEKRWGPFLLGSYFVCAFNQFPTAAQKYQHQPPNELELSWLVALLEKMRRARIYHGNLNAHNLLVTEQDIALIDLDQTQDFSAPIRSKIPGALRIFIHKHRKDRRRFLHDWRNKPAQLKCFTDVFERSDKHHTTSAWPHVKKP
ncbi:lipopolysaccharide kinase InaA family protein [Candidatus Spongiihabitans sp.]|uniref:lipopolysaccharide kinase InaA family protein n=1 Tax=Candidatus Spongiihabitans sp. TaxID=3101308 RepID=UPI003C7D3CF3